MQFSSFAQLIRIDTIRHDTTFRFDDSIRFDSFDNSLVRRSIPVRRNPIHASRLRLCLKWTLSKNPPLPGNVNEGTEEEKESHGMEWNGIDWNGIEFNRIEFLILCWWLLLGCGVRSIDWNWRTPILSMNQSIQSTDWLNEKEYKNQRERQYQCLCIYYVSVDIDRVEFRKYVTGTCTVYDLIVQYRQTVSVLIVGRVMAWKVFFFLEERTGTVVPLPTGRWDWFEQSSERAHFACKFKTNILREVERCSISVKNTSPHVEMRGINIYWPSKRKKFELKRME